MAAYPAAMADDVWPGEMPTVAEQMAECRPLLADFDDVSSAHMNALFYQQGYEELRINLGLLLDVLDTEVGRNVRGASHP